MAFRSLMWLSASCTIEHLTLDEIKALSQSFPSSARLIITAGTCTEGWVFYRDGDPNGEQ